VVWRYARQRDTLDYLLLRSNPGQLQAEMRRNKTVVGRTHFTRGKPGSLPVRR